MSSSPGSRQGDCYFSSDRYRPDGSDTLTTPDEAPSKDHLSAITRRDDGDEEAGVMSQAVFGNPIRQKAAQILACLCPRVPSSGQDEEVVSIVEYGATGSRSASIVRPVIEAFEHRDRDDTEGAGTGRSKSSYIVTHASMPSTDVRHLSKLSDSTYLDRTWLASHQLVDAVFSAYTSRAFGKMAVPPGSVSAGFSIMEMQRAFTKRELGVTDAQHAYMEMKSFLKARATEFRRGGLLVLAFPLDRHAYEKAVGKHLKSSLDSEPQLELEPSRPCLWTTLDHLVHLSVRTLVLRGLIRPSLASAMQSFPMHSRTASETRTLLRGVRDRWTVEWSCGLGSQVDADLGAHPVVESPLHLVHPAQRALDAGVVGQSVWAEHAVSFVRACYEPFCRSTLQAAVERNDKVEQVLEHLWDDVERRIAKGGLSSLELEVGFVALRRT